MPKKLGRPSPATVIACLALFFAVAGGSAIALQGRNTVDSGDIKKGQVKNSDIAKNAVTSAKIKNGQVRTADIQPAGPFNPVGPGGVPLGTGSPVGGPAENDCLWSTTNSASPFPFRAAPPGFYTDALGYVHLTGVLFASNGPGGDATCGGGAGESSEDAVAFILPQRVRPAHDVLRAVGPSGLAIIGATPLAFSGESFPSGAVAGLGGTGVPIILDGIVYEPAGMSGGLPRRGADAPAAAGGDMQDIANLFR